jgi:hypothetical protein
MTEPERRTTKRFRMLLRLLPAEFRGDFGPEMEQVFVEQREEEMPILPPSRAAGVSGGKPPKESSPPPRASIYPCCARIPPSRCA